jgi:hypothetical protein
LASFAKREALGPERKNDVPKSTRPSPAVVDLELRMKPPNSESFFLLSRSPLRCIQTMPEAEVRGV